MINKQNLITRREFFKAGMLFLIALAVSRFSFKSAGRVFQRFGGERRTNVSDKEGRFYKTLAG